MGFDRFWGLRGPGMNDFSRRRSGPCVLSARQPLSGMSARVWARPIVDEALFSG